MEVCLRCSAPTQQYALRRWMDLSLSCTKCNQPLARGISMRSLFERDGAFDRESARIWGPVARWLRTLPERPRELSKFINDVERTYHPADPGHDRPSCATFAVANAITKCPIRSRFRSDWRTPLRVRTVPLPTDSWDTASSTVDCEEKRKVVDSVERRLRRTLVRRHARSLPLARETRYWCIKCGERKQEVIDRICPIAQAFELWRTWAHDAVTKASSADWYPLWVPVDSPAWPELAEGVFRSFVAIVLAWQHLFSRTAMDAAASGSSWSAATKIAQRVAHDALIAYLPPYNRAPSAGLPLVLIPHRCPDLAPQSDPLLHQAPFG